MTIWEDFCKRNEVPEIYVSCTPSNIGIPPDDGKEYIAMCNALVKNPRSVMLLGKAGRGKTYFMYALLYGILMSKKVHPADVRFFRAIDLDSRLLDEYQAHKNASHFITELSKIPILFIDDFGLDRQTFSGERDYYNLIDKRVSSRRVTVISSNLEEEQLLQIFGERIRSRLKTFFVIDFIGPDLRCADKF